MNNQHLPIDGSLIIDSHRILIAIRIAGMMTSSTEFPLPSFGLLSTVTQHPSGTNPVGRFFFFLVQPGIHQVVRAGLATKSYFLFSLPSAGSGDVITWPFSLSLFLSLVGGFYFVVSLVVLPLASITQFFLSPPLRETHSTFFFLPIFFFLSPPPPLPSPSSRWCRSFFLFVPLFLRFVLVCLPRRSAHRLCRVHGTKNETGLIRRLFD